MIAVAICEMFGWTLEQYEDHPVQFLALIKDKMRIDAQKAEQQSKKQK